jgi:hypothetical protein
VRDDIVQLCSGGAGTEYGPFGAMPGPAEYRHFVLLHVSSTELSFEVFDAHGRVREQLAWPPALGEPDEAFTVSATEAASSLLERGQASELRLRIQRADEDRPAAPFTIYGFAERVASPSMTVSLDPSRGCVETAMWTGEGERLVWSGPKLPKGRGYTLDLAIHRQAGPGGVVGRLNDRPWSSLATRTAMGPGALVWPPIWKAEGDARPLIQLSVFE